MRHAARGMNNLVSGSILPNNPYAYNCLFEFFLDGGAYQDEAYETSPVESDSRHACLPGDPYPERTSKLVYRQDLSWSRIYVKLPLLVFKGA